MLATKLNENAYVTIYDIRYLSRALVLINSIRNTENNSDIVLLALDRDSEKALQKKDNSMIEYFEDRKRHNFRYSVNSVKIGYKPIMDFTDGLIKTISCYHENIDSWSRV